MKSDIIILLWNLEENANLDLILIRYLCNEEKKADYIFFNVGTGMPYTILDIAKTIISLCKKDLKPKILNKFRAGDIRHCYADISKITRKLRFEPKTCFKDGMKKLIEWSQSQNAYDLTSKAQWELKKRGLAN